MGEDKALLPFDTFATLTQYQLSRLEKIFKNVYISCKDASKFHFNASFIEDINTNDIYAPTTGFISIFKKLQAKKIFVISVDSPFIGENEIYEIMKYDSDISDATIAKTIYGIQPMCGIYHQSLEPKFHSMLNNNTHKLGFLLKNSKTTYVNFQNTKAFLNLNTPQEYQEALTLI